MAVIQGPSSNILASQLDFNPQRGTTQTIPANGLYADMLNLYNSWNTPYWTALGVTVELKSDEGAPTATVLVTIPYGDSEIPVPTYQLLNQKFEKHALSSINPNIQIIRQDDKRAIEQYFKKSENYLHTMPDFDDDFDTEAERTSALYTWLLMKDGFKSVVNFQPILKKEYPCSKNFPIPTPIIPIGVIATTGTVVGAEQVPIDTSILLPQSYSTTKRYVDFQADEVTKLYDVTLNFNYAWMKAGYDIVDTAYNRRKVSIEYHWGLWPEFVYGQPM